MADACKRAHVMDMKRLVPSPGDTWGPLPPHATLPPRRSLRWLERLLFCVACVLLAHVGYTWVEARLYQAYEDRELDAILRSRPATISPPPDAPTAPSLGITLGRIEIPRLHVSAIVRTGSDAATLSLAVGHIPGTA